MLGGDHGSSLLVSPSLARLLPVKIIKEVLVIFQGLVVVFSFAKSNASEVNMNEFR